jgi:hypothetical protein
MVVASTKLSSTGGIARLLLAICLIVLTISQSHTVLKRAYSIRLHAIENYGFGKINSSVTFAPFTEDSSLNY